MRLVARTTTLLHATQSAWITSTPRPRRALFAPEALLWLHPMAEEARTGFSTEADWENPLDCPAIRVDGWQRCGKPVTAAARSKKDIRR